MQVFKPKTSFVDSEHGEEYDVYDPMRNGTLECCCGYALFLAADGIYECEGGNHRYQINEGDVIHDKFGNVMLRIPESLKK